MRPCPFMGKPLPPAHNSHFTAFPDLDLSPIALHLWRFTLRWSRLANFVNQELWGAPTSVPWAIRFVEMTPLGPALGPQRHPSQLYEAFLEGIVLFAILSWMFWKTRARYDPGKLVGAFLFFYGCFRFGVEFIREPDQQLIRFAQTTGLHMGQWLSLPMVLGG